MLSDQIDITSFGINLIGPIYSHGTILFIACIAVILVMHR